MQVVLPELNQVVTASRDKAFDIVWFLSSRLVDQAAGNNGRTPTHCVTADLQENTHTWTKALRMLAHLRALLTVCALLIFFTSHC